MAQSILDIKEESKNIKKIDLQIQVDELVMDLYGLNEEEKDIIRNS